MNRIRAALLGSIAAAALAACATPMAPLPPPSAGLPAPMAQLAPMGMTARPDADMQSVLDALSALGARPIETLTVEQARTQPTPADAVNRVKTMRGMPTAPDPTVIATDLTYPTAGLQTRRSDGTPAGRGLLSRRRLGHRRSERL